MPNVFIENINKQISKLIFSFAKPVNHGVIVARVYTSIWNTIYRKVHPHISCFEIAAGDIYTIPIIQQHNWANIQPMLIGTHLKYKVFFDMYCCNFTFVIEKCSMKLSGLMPQVRSLIYFFNSSIGKTITFPALKLLFNNVNDAITSKKPMLYMVESLSYRQVFNLIIIGFFIFRANAFWLPIIYRHLCIPEGGAQYPPIGILSLGFTTIHRNNMYSSFCISCLNSEMYNSLT